MRGAERAAIVARLAEQIRRLEGDFAPACAGRVVSTALSGLDGVLAGGGLPAGSIVEILSPDAGGGGLTLATWLAGRAAGQAGQVVLIDRAGQFYPPAAAQMGLDLQRLVVIRPGCEADVLWAAQQALRCSAVAAVVVTALWRVDYRQCRRLQLAAEAGGGIGLVVRASQARGRVTTAAVRLLVRAVRCDPRRPRWSVEVLRCRGGRPSRPVLIGLGDEAGDVLADAVAVDRAGAGSARRASG